ncbi:MAG TPA: lipase family protein [Burkholderiales bacterium]|nr:lipase family protein [Burkholderiales bacterium]
MPLSNPQSVPYGLLVMYAEDMYSPNAANTLAPPPDARIAADGWDVCALLTAEDRVEQLKSPAVQGPAVAVRRVFFGFVARSKADANAYAVVIRGTEGLVEWIIDAQFAPIPHPRHPDTKVEHGFWNIFDTMQLADLQGNKTHDRATHGVAALIGAAGKAVVVGHSLGSSLATYFAQELAEQIGDRASACMFASPRTGDQAWVALFDATVQDYRLFNYVIDVVTHVPIGLGYATLSRATVLEPSTAQAGIRVDPGCNHHVICYCAMLDFAQTQPHTHDPQDQKCTQCILGGAATVPNQARLLATETKLAAGVGDKAVQLLKGRLFPH